VKDISPNPSSESDRLDPSIWKISAVVALCSRHARSRAIYPRHGVERSRYAVDSIRLRFGQAAGTADGDDGSQYHSASLRLARSFVRGRNETSSLAAQCGVSRESTKLPMFWETFRSDTAAEPAPCAWPRYLSSSSYIR